MEASTYISLGAVVIALLGLILNSKKETRYKCLKILRKAKAILFL